MSEPMTVWRFMMVNSSSVNRPGLLRISPGMEILPTSWRAEAVLMRVMSEGEMG